ncbi:papain-like cysteine protease family protein [Solwaraspora sp. WMMD1047]|uniref:papain-like cysteine protease family protein n=1 Tax=Solwaraspora sp. WMMD1047 TaxID=3016102 RepID=UPI002415A025|nr:papain-like cysteine protease family protein [Solwaraspora sp. WMMD1047]MDG4833396.1 papain-like cysteine protease family protein [Solwaraspora sp. WMMD1047]
MNTPNPLIAERVDSTTWYSGIGILETLDMTLDGINSQSWVDVSLGAVSTAAETAVWVVDPVGALVAAGFGFAVEHIKPLSDALDWLAGDPDQVDANAQTWRNVAKSHGTTVDLYVKAKLTEMPDWWGRAADAYRFRADQDVDLVRGLARAADGMASMVAITGSLVATARTLVRDLIAECVSVLLVRLPLWTAEEVLTLGIATPYVGSQISALVAKWAARIARVLRAVIRSLDNLSPLARQLDEIVGHIANLLRRRTTDTGPVRAIPAGDPSLAGAGGNWRTIDEAPGGAIAQQNDASCVSATGAMLSGRSQDELLDSLGAPAPIDRLPEALGPGWRGGYVGPDALDLLNQRAPWGAELKDPTNSIGHAVVVDGVRPDGRIAIRDPWGGGSTYAMDLDEFLEYWNGNAVFKQ